MVVSALFIFTFIFVLLYSGFLTWHLVWWNRIKGEPLAEHPCSTRVSVIIAARNEEKNIGKCLASVLGQDYPKELTEVIVCDDQSEDHTMEEAARVLAGSKVNHKVVEVTAPVSNKKKAIETAVNIALGELVILTDADCSAEKTWITSLAGAYEQTRAAMICGPVALTGEQNFCDRFQSLELCGLSLLAGAGIAGGIPLMCNGANIAYKREAFFSVGGYEGIEELPSGDDTLLLYKIAKKYPGAIHFIKSRQAIVYTHAQPGWKEFLQQRVRWASKGFRGNNKLNAAAGLVVFLTDFLLLVSGFYQFFAASLSHLFVVSIILKSAVDFLLLTFAAKFFDKKKLLAFFLISELITIIYTSMVGLIAHTASYSWKGRKYKSRGTKRRAD